MIKKGFQEDTIKTIFDTLDEREELDSASDSLKKMRYNIGIEFEQKQKLIRKLAGRGFDYGTIKAAIEEFNSTENSQRS